MLFLINLFNMFDLPASGLYLLFEHPVVRLNVAM